MGVFLPYSQKPLIYDTLPAYKVQYYQQTPNQQKIYCYARLYLLQGQLAVNMVSFEAAPAPESRMGFLMQSVAHAFYLEAAPDKTVLYTINENAGLPWCAACQPAAQQPQAAGFAGQDEQGSYWGVELLLPAQASQQLGLQPGAVFEGCLFKYFAGKPGYGCTVKQADGIAAELDTFTIAQTEIL